MVIAWKKNSSKSALGRLLKPPWETLFSDWALGGVLTFCAAGCLPIIFYGSVDLEAADASDRLLDLLTLWTTIALLANGFGTLIRTMAHSGGISSKQATDERIAQRQSQARKVIDGIGKLVGVAAWATALFPTAVFAQSRLSKTSPDFVTSALCGYGGLLFVGLFVAIIPAKPVAATRNVLASANLACGGGVVARRNPTHRSRTLHHSPPVWWRKLLRGIGAVAVRS